jgi:predicted nucleic acid-binding protein
MSAHRIHLDTNYLIYYTSSDNEEIISRIDSWQRQGSKIYVSAMVWAEYQCGPLTEREGDLAHDVIHGVLPLTQEIGHRAGFLFRATGRRSRSLPDCIIAATAMSEGVPLATMNHTDFSPFLPHGLELI